MMNVTLFIDADHSLYHASYVITGLFSLLEKGQISLAIKHPGRSWRRTWEGSGIVHLLIRDQHLQGAVSLTLDLHDMSNKFHLPSLTHSDVYLKRSYFGPHLHEFAQGARAAIAPFGLNYACRLPRSLPSVIRCALLSLLTKSTATPLRLYIPRIARNVAVYWSLLPPEAFTRALDSPKEEVVFFQTRLWETSDVSGEDSAEVVNEERATLVASLKRAFGKRFWGGLTPSQLASATYAPLLSPLDTDQRKYIAVQARALIGVYSRGLHFSNAWKLPEYLAASMCVVASPLRNTLPTPLRSGMDILTYVSPDECVAACDQILSDRSLQHRLRAAAAEYFQQHCEPAVHMLDCLNRAVALFRETHSAPTGQALVR